MKVVHENINSIETDQLPQILMRIFNVCKADPSFPIKEQLKDIENELKEVEKRIDKQHDLMKQTVEIRDNLSNRLQKLRQENFEKKTKLLEDLGSEI